MIDHPADVLRPDDRDLLRASLRTLAARAQIGILFAGLVEDGALTITEFIGTSTGSLDRLFVQRGEGVGGGAMARGKPTAVADYVAAPQISHQHDEAVRREGLRSMVALPVTVDAAPRAIVYAATRERVSIGDRLSVELVEGVRAIAAELRTRDEVDRRVSLLRGTELPTADRESHDLREAVRIAHGELLALASMTDDDTLARRILAVTEQLTGQSVVSGAPRPDPTRGRRPRPGRSRLLVPRDRDATGPAAGHREELHADRHGEARRPLAPRSGRHGASPAPDPLTPAAGLPHRGVRRRLSCV